MPYFPEGMPDPWKGGNDVETIDKLYGAAKGMRDQIATRGTIPKEAKGYDIKFSDKASPYLSPADDDKVLGTIRDLALKHQFTDKQMPFFGDFVDALIDSGAIQKPMSGEQVLTELAGPEFKGTPDEAKTAGQQRLTKAQAWIDGLTDKKGFTQGERDQLAAVATTLDGVSVIEKFMKGGMQVTANPGGRGAGQVSEADLNARVADPRNNWGTPQYDPAYAAETQRLFQQVHG